jgi:hypothetical protein
MDKKTKDIIFDIVIAVISTLATMYLINNIEIINKLIKG